MKIDYDNSGIEYLKAQEIPQLFQDITDIFVDSQQHINHSHQLIEAGTIKQDPKQDRVLELIDQLYVQIESYSPPSLPSKPCPNCASGTFNKSQQETKTRQCIIDALIQTIIAPFGRVRFRDFFMGDVLTSLVKVLANLYLAICVLSLEEYFTLQTDSFCISSTTTKIIKPLCICGPYWFRFAQCLNRYFNTHDRIPHLPNAMKYGTEMSVTLLGTLHSTYGTLQKDLWTPGRII